MARDKVQRWRLFIDESGNFAAPEDEVVVAGLLVPEGAPNSHPVQIRSALEEAVDGLIWPLKASELNHPVLLALALPSQRATAEKHAPARAVLVHLEKTAAADVEIVRCALNEGRRLPYEALARLDDMARSHEAYPGLQRSALDAGAMVGRCIGRMAPSGGALGALLIACGETARGQITGGRPGDDDETRRYLGLLEGVLQRAVDVTARSPERSEMLLEILERDVSDEILSATRHVRLHHYRHVIPIVQRIEQRSRCLVQVAPQPVHRWRQNMHGALVLADFVANRARNALRREGRRLAEIEDQLVRVVCCPVRSGDPGASHIAAWGAAQDRIEAARASEATTLPPPKARRWALEQADEWVEVLRR